MVFRRTMIPAALLLICATTVAAPDAQLSQDCGACHGLHMTGGLGPELTRTALAGKSRDSLIATVTHGRPGTAMPGWAPLLGADDIRWLVDLLLQGYPAP
ncbi:c-type cytochrome precursor [Pseudomonas sp. CFII64]|uniref:c-type cytochrome n=1 Tax=Pseudomonas sp. CFII64 TaxID=911242 RepID=UPI0003574270|nr:cytochrome c [Pseudomonas sp. CFII64]EPJ80243.1 c-type cytochrome precursor [Pseudomonas sp. CFII64]